MYTCIGEEPLGGDERFGESLNASMKPCSSKDESIGEDNGEESSDDWKERYESIFTLSGCSVSEGASI